MIKHVPNLMTLSRILLTPLMIYFMISESNQNYSLAFIFFVIASITDYFDCKIARKYDIESRFGIFIDPLADIDKDDKEERFNRSLDYSVQIISKEYISFFFNN